MDCFFAQFSFQINSETEDWNDMTEAPSHTPEALTPTLIHTPYPVANESATSHKAARRDTKEIIEVTRYFWYKKLTGY